MNDIQLFLLATDCLKIKNGDSVDGEFVQCGKISGTTDANGYYNIGLPVPFPNAIMSFSCTLMQDGSLQTPNPYYVVATNLTVSVVQVQVFATSGSTVNNAAFFATYMITGY